jgi:hypothetical protein
MSDNTNSNNTTSDDWGPWGPPSTWRKKFQEQNYNEFMSKKVKEYQANPNFVPFGRRTATQILEDAYREQREIWERSNKSL